METRGHRLNKITVLIADDHTIVRKGLCALLAEESDIEVVGDAKDGRETISKVEQLQPDVVLMDISMPGLNGMDATRQIKKRFPDTKILILSMHSNDKYVFETLQAGASGYLIKRTAPVDLIKAIHVAYRDESFLSPSISKKVIERFVGQKQDKIAEPQGLQILTEREREVLQLIAEGNANREIAQQLHLSTKTIEVHRHNIQSKLQLQGTAKLTKYAIRNGLVDLES